MVENTCGSRGEVGTAESLLSVSERSLITVSLFCQLLWNAIA